MAHHKLLNELVCVRQGRLAEEVPDHPHRQRLLCPSGGARGHVVAGLVMWCGFVFVKSAGV